MHTTNYDIRPFDLRSSSPAEYACLNTFRNILRLEELPEDPPIPLSQEVERWQALPPFLRNSTWAAWDRSADRIVAAGQANIYLTGDNEHLIQFQIQVLPDWRRQGIGRELLQLITAHARTAARRVMETEVSDRLPASSAFLLRIGARRGMEAGLSQLQLQDLDPGLVPGWLERTRRLVTDFDFQFIDGPIPDDRLQDLADLMQEVGNDEPRDSLDREDENFTPENVRQFAEMQLVGGRERWILSAIDRKTDRLIGMTEVVWNPVQPELVLQSFTGVRRAHRSQGVGRRLKVMMLDRILRDRPGVKWIRTGNADSNAPMLKINTKLGYKPFVSWAMWQVETSAVEKYLSGTP